jgi:hypothetical protein
VWFANLENGTSTSEEKGYWTDLSREVRLTGLQLAHPKSPRFLVSLSNYDKYYFAREAVSVIGGGPSESMVQAEIIGGHDIALNVGIEVRMELTGAVRVKTYPLARYKYSPTILFEGKRNNGKPGYFVSPDAGQPVVSSEEIAAS